MANNILQTTELINKLNTILEKHANLLNKSAVEVEKLNKSYSKLPSQFVKAQQQQLQTQTKLKTSTANLTAQTQKLNTSIKSKIPTLTRLASLRRAEVRQLEKTSGLYNRVQQAINKVTKKYQDLAVRKQLGGKLSAREEKQLVSLQAKLLKYNNALKKVDAQVGKNSRNVGNYKSALGGLAVGLRSLAGAFGLTSGVFLFAQAMRDSFGRIRDFDKSMQNLSGILGTTRGEISNVEDAIISVASVSIKTSNEVADLAQSLATLGKRGQDLINLIKPANDLSIALQATSDEAGAFLVQTLNAFGEPSSSAKEFANTITAIRTSTTLDFQKMRDSFQYITPIAKILNLDLADTGALVGVLADNGLKAESAGRLLGTALQKIAKEGGTLESALEQINKAQREGIKEYDLLALASDLFGKQAAKIGIILADNIDTVEASSKSIRENANALDGLINQQLESLDAKLKILDSTWEAFLLSLEDGNNIIGGALKYSIGVLAGAIENLGIVTSFVSNGFENTSLESAKLAQNLANLIPIEGGLIGMLKSKIDKQVEYNESVKKYREIVQGEINDYVKLNETIAPHLRNLDKLVGNYEDLAKLLGFYSKEQEKEIDTIGSLRKDISDLNTQISESSKLDVEGIRIKQDKIKEIQKEIDIALGLTKAVTENTKALEDNNKVIEDTFGILDGTIPFYEEIIKGLVDQQNQLSRNTREWYSYQQQIDGFTDSLVQLKRQLTGDYSSSEGTAAASNLVDNLVSGFNPTDNSINPPEDTEDNWRQTFQSITEISGKAFGIITQMSNAAFEKQFADLEKQKNAAFMFTEEGTAARIEQERQYDEKLKEIQIRQAKAKKAQSIFDITIDTARAVVSVLAQEPGGILKKGIAATIVGALGAAQIAMVAAQPLPQFWEGGRVGEGGGSQQIMVNDDPLGKKGANYKEVIQKPNGDILKPQGKNVKMTVPNGSYVHPTYDSFINRLDTELIGNNIMPVGAGSITPIVVNQGLNKGDVLDIMQQHGKDVVRAINNKEAFSFTYDERGAEIRRKKLNNQTKIMNARYSGKGMGV
jgi:hypothetical protein